MEDMNTHYFKADGMHKRPLLDSPPVPPMKRPLLQHPSDVGPAGHHPKRALLGPPDQFLADAPWLDSNPGLRVNDRHERPHLPQPLTRQPLLPTPNEWDPPPEYFETDFEDVGSDSEIPRPYQVTNFKPSGLLPPPSLAHNDYPLPGPHMDRRPLLSTAHHCNPPSGLLPLPGTRNNGPRNYRETNSNVHVPEVLKKEPLLQTPPVQGFSSIYPKNQKAPLLPLVRPTGMPLPDQHQHPRKPPLLEPPRMPYKSKPANGHHARVPPLICVPPVHTPPLLPPRGSERGSPLLLPRGSERGSPMYHERVGPRVYPHPATARNSPTNTKRPLLPTPKQHY